MDYLERYEAEGEAKREAITSTAAVGSAMLADGKKTDMPKELYPITVIGCIRGFDGWYQAGYDHRKETIVPLDRIEVRRINEDCPTCNRSDPKTNTCREAGTIYGGTPCIYWFPRGRKQFERDSSEVRPANHEENLS